MQTTHRSMGSVTHQIPAKVLRERLSLCLDDVSAQMMANRLQLNLAKTKVLWCPSARHQFQIPIGPVRVGNTSVLPASAVQDLGVYTDADITMRAHVTATTQAGLAFYPG